MKAKKIWQKSKIFIFSLTISKFSINNPDGCIWQKNAEYCLSLVKIEVLLWKKLQKSSKIFFTIKTDFLCSFQKSYFYHSWKFRLAKKRLWSILSLHNETTSYTHYSASTVVNKHIREHSGHLYSQFTNFNRDPCNFGNTKKKLGWIGYQLLSQLK